MAHKGLRQGNEGCPGAACATDGPHPPLQELSSGNCIRGEEGQEDGWNSELFKEIDTLQWFTFEIPSYSPRHPPLNEVSLTGP